MAIRNIRRFGDPVLRKECKEIRIVTPRLKVLAQDMLDTMYEADGVGLAAPQVGVLKQLVVIDVGEGPLVMLNPVITESDGEQTDREGCLSYPGMAAMVTRPLHVVVQYYDLNMKFITLDCEGLLARAVCHELDHLHGIIYTDVADGEAFEVNYEEEDEQ